MESFEGAQMFMSSTIDEHALVPVSMVRGPVLTELYPIVECISRGSPGTVYIVQNKKNHLHYVLKKIECHDESTAIKAFFEKMELRRLDHPYVCHYKEFFITYEKTDSSVFINTISEYFPDGSLEDFIRSYYDKEQIIPEETIGKILGEMFESLCYIHGRGVIHRCIKPSNIFLKPNGAIALGDLGVSTIMSDMRNNTRATFKNTVYLAPETLRGPHSEKSDYYSMGCVLLQLVTASNYSTQTFVKRLRDFKEDMDILNAMYEKAAENYSKNLVNFIQSLMRPDPALRPDELELEKNRFLKELMLRVDSSQLDKRSRQIETKALKTEYSLAGNRKNIHKVLEFIANTIDHENCVAEGLGALAEIIRDDDKAHEKIDQQARNLISLAMWDNIFNKDVQISGCYVLSNLVVFCDPNDILFTPQVITILHKIMNSHEDNVDVQLAAVNFILALSADERAATTIVQLGGIQDILNAMRESPFHANLCAMCCMALWSLSVDEENLKIASTNEAVKDVGKALNVHKVSPEVCEAAAAAFVSLLLDDSAYEAFNELDCVGNLVVAITLHTQNAKVVRNCCKVLTTVVEANEECAYRFLTSDNPNDNNPTGIPTLLEAYRLHKDDAMVVEAIVRLLLELSGYGEICLDLKAAKINLVLAEVRRKFNENKDIMGPVEEALDKLGSGGTRLHKDSS